LRQVIFNLVSNAQDALNKKKKTGGGSVRDTITIRSFRENDRVAMVVSDTGIGIPAYVKRWIYEPFFTTKETGRGKGLGLFITYGIVRDYGGNIHVETREGEGTTFKLTFPFARE
jgi:C4-dicarboxylate-specific signal transduction histidine kinase